MVWEGKDAVKTGRVMLGATNPLASSPGTSASRPCCSLSDPAQPLIRSTYSPW